tara:strand:- start:2611 stop:3129 length:519 start_codon:yes stop_codon:yes gene_type:complete
MIKTTKSQNKLLLSFFALILTIPIFLMPLRAYAEIAETDINGQLIEASSEFLRDLDYETWQLVAYKSSNSQNKLILRIIGYPGSLRIDHPLSLKVESGRKNWLLNDKTLLNEELASDTRQAAAEFDLEQLIDDIKQNRPLRLSLSGVFSELPVPPFLVKEWRSLGLSGNENL